MTNHVFFFKKAFFVVYFGFPGSSLPCGFSLVVAGRGSASLWRAGFSLQRLLLLWSMGSGVQTSTVVACGLQSTGPGAVVQGLSCSAVACGIFPDQKEPGSPALAGGFLTTGPPGKSLCFLFNSSKLTFFFPPDTSLCSLYILTLIFSAFEQP